MTKRLFASRSILLNLFTTLCTEIDGCVWNEKLSPPTPQSNSRSLSHSPGNRVGNVKYFTHQTSYGMRSRLVHDVCLPDAWHADFFFFVAVPNLRVPTSLLLVCVVAVTSCSFPYGLLEAC